MQSLRMVYNAAIHDCLHGRFNFSNICEDRTNPHLLNAIVCALPHASC